MSDQLSIVDSTPEIETPVIPKMDKIFEIGRVYRICSDSTPLVYIGSTTQTLEQRFKNHQSGYDSWLGSLGRGLMRNYISSYEIFKWGDARIELIETMQFKPLSKLRKREYELISSTENCINISGSKCKNKKSHLAKLLNKEGDTRKITCKCGGVYFDKREYRGWHMMTKEHIEKMEEIYCKST
jgi:predicted GIY-YIG superfamily endonuclease